jgi:uncharacterized protein (TIGR02996 family)
MSRASQQFLAAIQAAPDDDAPRLVYADWLQKRGDVLGEFIVIQCTLAAMGEDQNDDARADLQVRQSELFTEHAPAWFAELGLAPNEGVFRRGFVEQVSVPFTRLKAAQERLGQRAVVRELWIFSYPEGSSLSYTACQRLFSWPWLRLLHTLLLQLHHLGFSAIRMLAQSPHLANLVRLDLTSNNLGAKGAQALAESSYLANLRSLELTFNHIGDDGAKSLAEASWFANLTSLELADNSIGDEGLRALLGTQQPGKLEEIGLASNLLKRAPELTQSPSLASLRSLDLRDNPLDLDTRALLLRHFGERVLL